MSVTTPNWTNRLLTCNAVYEEDDGCPKRKDTRAKLDDAGRSRERVNAPKEGSEIGEDPPLVVTCIGKL